MDFLTAINRILGLEGGYSNDPKDPGGETNWGISKRSYPNVDIKNLTRDGAIGIYQRDFWQASDADKMPAALSYQALDFAVNSSPRISIQKLQRALGVADDGWWGPVTQAKMQAARQDTLIFLFLAERLEFMTRLSGWTRFGAGWGNRIAKDLRYAAQDLL